MQTEMVESSSNHTIYPYSATGTSRSQCQPEGFANLPSAAQSLEADRLAALRRTELLDSPREPEFDELVEIAAAICGAPMSMVSLVDEDRQWFKAALGVDLTETSREVSFCTHAIQQDDIFTVEDATQDDRFRDNPFVAGDLGIRFYAGFPLSSPDGFHLGSLCVLDRKPHRLTAAQETALRTLARQVNARIELRQQRRELQRALAEAEEAKTKLQASDRRFKAFMDSGPILSYLKDNQGKLVYYNQPFADRFGVNTREWIGRDDEDRDPPEIAAVVRAHDLEVLDTLQPHIYLESSRNRDGSRAQWRSYKFPCQDSDGKMLLGGISIDVTAELVRDAELRRSRTELEEANRKLRDLATTDGLTGLANRRVFDERMELEFARARRKKLNLAVLMLDVDNFKHRNDTYGHDNGDQVLRQLAKCIRHAVRDTDFAARYGGEEFVVLLPECDEEQAIEMSKRIIKCVHAERWSDEPVTVSVGAAAMDDATSTPQRQLILADEALYAAKRAGKNRAVGYHAYYDTIVADLKA
jgi:diguanylate cyclase (GGDEF)-like protein/PAS domain S-box-containing protein